ncbi:hypothetical protein Tco_1126372, partial [Tanacetum coccineum]
MVWHRFHLSDRASKAICDIRRKMYLHRIWKVGTCEDVLGGLNKDEQNAIMDASMALFGKFLATTSDTVYSSKGTTNAGPMLSESEWNTSTPLGTFLESIQSWRSFWLAANKDIGSFRASSAVQKKGRANFRPLESENVCDGVNLTIPIKIVEK